MRIGRTIWTMPRTRARRLSLEMLESRRVMTAVPYGAIPQDTAEFMLGKVAVTPVFLESNGQLDTSTEDWTDELIEETLLRIEQGVDWWVDTLATLQSVHTLDFAIDTTYVTTPAETRYEPISRRSNDYRLWVQEFLSDRGYDTIGGLDADIRAFNAAQREKLDADWSFTMFVVNSENDVDDGFAPGGQFHFAFGFAGGLFLVSPSTRPASTFAHETGHMFWAKDEYAGGGSWSDRRGYYNTQNWNAADNPTPGFKQQPSIMASGDLLDDAYADHVSPPSTLAMVGWQDSDQDGIFDVLDVPLEMTGVGYYDTAVSAYKFRGAAKVGVLPNLNSEGVRNDITLNRISTIQHRVDNGPWTTVETPDAYETEVDLSIPLATLGQVIEIRAVDNRTGVSSNVFQGRMTRADAVPTPGINGFVWIDTNGNELRDQGELGQAGWTVEVLSNTQQPLSLRRAVDPDALPDGVLTTGSVPGISITAIGADSDGRAGVFADSTSGSSSKEFRVYSRASQSWTPNWTGVSRRMKVTFGTPTSLVEIEAIGTSANSYGRIEAYDAAGNLIDRFTTTKLGDGQVATMRVESAAGLIASVCIGGHANSAVRLDRLQFGPLTEVTTRLKGQFSVPGLPSGEYIVKVTPPTGENSPLGNGGDRQGVIVTAGTVVNDVDFAFQTVDSPWRNPQNHLDVNNDQLVAALDVLLIVNELNQYGPRQLPGDLLPPPYIDVNGDNRSSALDALWIINYINEQGDIEAERATVPAPLAEIGSADAVCGLPQATSADSATAELSHGEALLAMTDELEAWQGPWFDVSKRRSTHLVEHGDSRRS